MFKTILFAGLLTVALAAPMPTPGPMPGPAAAPGSALLAPPLVTSLGPILPSIGAPILYNLPAPYPHFSGYIPPLVYKPVY